MGQGVEDSSAGMIPSDLASSWKASSASLSVTEGYSARPMAARWACWGPTEGKSSPAETE